MIPTRNPITSLLSIAVLASVNCQAAESCSKQPSLNDQYSEGWGIDARNTRFQPRSTINQTNVAQLELDWVFALDDGGSPHSYPLVTEDTVFIGTDVGNVYALEKSTGCQRWIYEAGSPIRSGIAPGTITVDGVTSHTLFFGTWDGTVRAVEALTGNEIWRADITDHAYNVVTGTPVFYQGELFVPVSSMEVALAINPFYGCCTSSGALVALNADTGEQRWRTNTIPDPPKVTGRHFFFVEEWGPSGAPVWSAPTIDPGRDLIYIGTGENYTRPASHTSDAIMALSRKDGAVRWVQQYTALDAFNMSCGFANHPNCPEDSGPDLDFGAPPILARTREGQEIVLAGQKSGGVYGIDPDSGDRIWGVQFGRGGMLGGVHWGLAINERLGLLYAPISDVPTGSTDKPAEPGLNALDIGTGEVRWSTPNSNRCAGRSPCQTGMSAAIIATDDLVFAGALDGHVHAYSATSGEILWSYDTWREFDSTNNLATQGGAIDVHGPIVAGDLLLIQSGYGTFGQRGGNALLAFRLEASK